MSVLLLRTKLYIPPVRPGLVPRLRLIERLNAGLLQNGLGEGAGFARKLTLVSAPAGFGKTTLLSEWISQRLSPPTLRADSSVSPQVEVAHDKASSNQSLRFAWVSLDDDDNDPVRFLAYLVGALQTIEARIGKGLLSAFRAPKSPPIQPALTTLINEVAAISGQLALVLDDYHLITAQPIHDVLEFLLDHLPANLHLVIATRSDPPLHLARLRGRGQLTEVRVPDLRFTVEEATAFLNDIMQLDLSPEDVSALTARTEGWVASLQMAAISLEGQRRAQGVRDVSGFVQAFTGSHHFILDYLMEEVLDQQSEAVQEFLLKTSVLDRLTGLLCDFILEGYDYEGVPWDGRVILEQLEQANLFLIPLDDERRWYRYHHLFADLLRQRLQQTQPDILPGLHQQASTWYELNGLIPEAIDQALAADDFERAGDLIERTVEVTFMRGEFVTFMSWVAALPDDVVQSRPLLCAYQALMLLLGGGSFDEFNSRLQDAARSDASDLVSGAVTLLRAVVASFQGDAQRSIELSHQALELLPERNMYFRSFVARNLGGVYKLTGDVAAAIRAIEEAVRISQKAGDLTGIVVATHQLAEQRTIQGRLYEAQILCQRALELAVDGQGRPLPLAARVLVLLGELSREWNDLEAAELRLLEAIELAEKWAGAWSLSGYLILACVRQAQGDVDGVRKAIQTALQLAREYDTTDLDDFVVLAFQARLFIAQGDLEAAVRWVEERGLGSYVGSGEMEQDLSGVSGAYYVREFELTTLARLHLAQGRPDEALAALEPLLETTERLGRTGRVIEVLALQALAFQAQGDAPRALITLERALSLAKPAGYVRIFVDAGEPMARLLRQAALHSIAPDYVRKLLTAFEIGTQELYGESTTEALSWSLVEPLSERELDVMRLLATQLSSAEIAQELFVATSTVRSHIKSIYSKLDVHSRKDAVQRAEELRLF